MGEKNLGEKNRVAKYSGHAYGSSFVCLGYVGLDLKMNVENIIQSSRAFEDDTAGPVQLHDPKAYASLLAVVMVVYCH